MSLRAITDDDDDDAVQRKTQTVRSACRLVLARVRTFRGAATVSLRSHGWGWRVDRRIQWWQADGRSRDAPMAGRPHRVDRRAKLAPFFTQPPPPTSDMFAAAIHTCYGAAVVRSACAAVSTRVYHNSSESLLVFFFGSFIFTTAFDSPSGSIRTPNVGIGEVLLHTRCKDKKKFVIHFRQKYTVISRINMIRNYICIHNLWWSCSIIKFVEN